MAIVAPIFALIGRFVGRVLTTTLGWASVLLFGRVPQDRQVWLAVLTFGSLAWVAAAAGILAPDVGAFLLTALPTPDWIDDDLVRLAMLATALLLPAVLGVVTLLLLDPGDRPRGFGQLRHQLQRRRQMNGRLPAQQGDLALSRAGEEVGDEDEVLPRQELARGPVHLPAGEAVGAGAVALGGEEDVGHG